MYVCVSVWVCASECHAHRGQKRKLDFVGQEQQAVVSHMIWVLGRKLALQEQRVFLIPEPFLQPRKSSTLRQIDKAFVPGGWLMCIWGYLEE